MKYMSANSIGKQINMKYDNAEEDSVLLPTDPNQFIYLYANE